MVIHNMMIGRSDDTFWNDVNMEVQGEEWEEEAEAVRALMRGEDDAIAMAETEDENMKEALRYHYSSNRLSLPYTDDCGFQFYGCNNPVVYLYMLQQHIRISVRYKILLSIYVCHNNRFKSRSRDQLPKG
jgi:hypothetical protein